MEVVVSKKYGSPNDLQFEEVEKPMPKDQEVLVKVHAASLNYGNLVLLSGKPYLARVAFGLFKPKYAIPGGDIAGTVEAVGQHVTHFKPGDEVFGDLSGFGWGGFAEYAAVPEKALAHKPENLTLEEAAAVPMAAATALQALHKANIAPGQKVLIHGASGGVGTFAVQIAKAYRTHVTAVCSTRNIDIAQSLGADRIIDYKQEDLAQLEEQFDVILAVNGNISISVYQRLLQPGGVYVSVGGTIMQTMQATLLGPLISLTTNKKMTSFLQRANQEDLYFLKELIEANKCRPVIDRTYKLSQIREAFKYFDRGHAKGKVVIII